jgi:hypothetical protein
LGSGFIYILVNDSFSGMIKIGSTAINAQERARQLSANTAVPTPYKVAYEIYVDNCETIERKIHNELNDFRVTPNREFFRYPLNKAIDLIQRVTSKRNRNNEDEFEAIEILPAIKAKFGKLVNPQISSARIYQNYERLYFESTIDEYISEYLKDQLIRRTDLGFIGDDPFSLMFNPNDPVQINAEEFLTLDVESILYCIDDLLII